MSTLDTGLTLIRNASQRVSAANGRMGNAPKGWMPTGLYARALLIMIVPMVVLQTVVAFVFMERHWNTVTRRLSAAVVQDIASLIDVYKGYPQDKDRAQLRKIGERLQLTVDFLAVGDMPPPGPKPFFSLLDQTLSVQLRPPDRQAVLDRYRRPFQPGRNPDPARRFRDAHLRPAQRGLCVEFGDLHLLDAGDILDPPDRRGAIPAQPDQAYSAAGGCRRKFRQGPRGAELPSAPARARSAARGTGIPANESAHRTLDRTTHRDAGRRVARSTHHPDPLQARTRADRRQPRSRRHAQGCRRDVGDAGRRIWPLRAATPAKSPSPPT